MDEMVGRRRRDPESVAGGPCVRDNRKTAFLGPERVRAWHRDLFSPHVCCWLWPATGSCSFESSLGSGNDVMIYESSQLNALKDFAHLSSPDSMEKNVFYTTDSIWKRLQGRVLSKTKARC